MMAQPTVFVVDDNPGVRNAVQALVESEGFAAETYASGEEFLEAYADFLIIERDAQLCEEVRARGYACIEGDATHEEALLKARLKSASSLLALLDSDPDNLFIALTARELNPTLHIVARAEAASSDKRILRAGADTVISPFHSAGKQVALEALAPELPPKPRLPVAQMTSSEL